MIKIGNLYFVSPSTANAEWRSVRLIGAFNDKSARVKYFGAVPRARGAGRYLGEWFDDGTSQSCGKLYEQAEFPKPPQPAVQARSLEEQALIASLKRMLEVYWGEGDGAPDPEFIAEAKRLVADR